MPGYIRISPASREKEGKRHTAEKVHLSSERTIPVQHTTATHKVRSLNWSSIQHSDYAPQGPSILRVRGATTSATVASARGGVRNGPNLVLRYGVPRFCARDSLFGVENDCLWKQADDSTYMSEQDTKKHSIATRSKDWVVTLRIMTVTVTPLS